MTKLTQQNAENIFRDMLIDGEYTLYPVYCGFQKTGFFARPGRMQIGYAACTNFGRLFMANLGYGLGSCNRSCFLVSSAKQLSLRKNLFGQTIVEAVFPTNGKDFKVKMQIASKVYGCDFPNQPQYSEKLLAVLRQYER